MLVGKDFAKDRKVKSEFLDSSDSDDVESASPFSESVFKPIHKSKIDSKLIEGVSQGAMGYPDIKNAIHVAERESVETYDRESILYELSHPDNLGAIEKLERMCENSGGKISTKYSPSSTEFRKLQTEKLRESLKAVPDTLLHMLTGKARPGDCGRSLHQKPDWLDTEKLRRGQKFAQDHMFSVFLAEFFTFSATYTFESILKPLIMTEKSSTPYTAFRRYLSTVLRVRRWYTQDFWTEGSAAQKDFAIVRAIHGAVRRKLTSITNDELDAAARIPDPWCTMRKTLLKDFSEACKAPIMGQCPYASGSNDPDRPKGINQVEMAFIQWSFISLITSCPRAVGIHYATDEDLEAYCYLWRCIGYMLGIEDQYNFCRGTLEEIRQRGHDFVETWVKPNLRVITPEWEHMVRCIFSGMGVIIPGISYEVAILYLSDNLDLKIPRFYASLSYKDWLSYLLMRFFLNYTIKLPGVSGWINGVLNRNLDRAEKFTDEELETWRIKLSNYPGTKEIDFKKEETIFRGA